MIQFARPVSITTALKLEMIWRRERKPGIYGNKDNQIGKN